MRKIPLIKLWSHSGLKFDEDDKVIIISDVAMLEDSCIGEETINNPKPLPSVEEAILR